MGGSSWVAQLGRAFKWRLKGQQFESAPVINYPGYRVYGVMAARQLWELEAQFESDIFYHESLAQLGRALDF